MLLSVNRDDPEPWFVARAADFVRQGGVVVVPTDSVYAIVCSYNNPEAIKRLCHVKGISSAKRLSIFVSDIATASQYARISTPVFRVMRRVLPGPYTFIFHTTTEVPKTLAGKRHTIGIRMPASSIVSELLKQVGEPLLATSVRNQGDDFLLDPMDIDQQIGHQVDIIIDGGLLPDESSTVVDFTGPEPVLVRKGKGDVNALGIF